MTGDGGTHGDTGYVYCNGVYKNSSGTCVGLYSNMPGGTECDGVWLGNTNL